MNEMLEIVIPLRNPTEVVRKTVASLLDQSDYRFTVLLSDNGSTSGIEFINDALSSLKARGLSVRLVRPPALLGRVEHWNWSHQQATGEWIKPLFVGDWLSSDYVRQVTSILPDCGAEIVNCSMASHYSDGSQAETRYIGGHQSREEVLDKALTFGNAFGGPVNICFSSLGFRSVGGYPPALPVSADFWLILMLALRRGLATCPDVLAHFNFHPTRFSTNFPTGRINGPREYDAILTAAISYACFEEIPHDPSKAKRLLRQLWWDGLKERLRGWIRAPHT